jgi:hypothetical protein
MIPVFGLNPFEAHLLWFFFFVPKKKRGAPPDNDKAGD